MRWDRFFDDLEDQLASEWEAERAALDTEAERLRLSTVGLRDRICALTSRDRTGAVPSFELCDGTVVTAEVTALGADWLALEAPGPRVGAHLVPLGAVEGIRMTHADLLRSARGGTPRSLLADRLTFGFVLRDLVRRRAEVAVHLARGRTLTGTIDRAGSDHFDLAQHEPGVPRRADSVDGHRLVPFAAVAWIGLSSAPLS
jgi:hypothetical protein